MTLNALTLATLISLAVATPALASPPTETSSTLAMQTDLAIASSEDSLGYRSADSFSSPSTSRSTVEAEDPSHLEPHLAPQPSRSASPQRHWTDEGRKQVQHTLHLWANEMNDWFGEPDPREPATANLRVIMDTRWVDDPLAGSHVTVEPRVRGRLRLPVLERRLSLIIGDEDLDNETVLRRDSTGRSYHSETSSQDKIVDRKKVRDDNASIALRWSRFDEALENELGIETDVDVGVRSGDDLYVKVSVDKDWFEDEQLKVSSDSFYRYGLDSEHFARAAVELKFGSDSDRFINNRTTLRYRHEDDDERTDWSNDLRQVHYFADQKQLSYGVTASGDFGDDKPLLNSYGPAISYRQPIWRDWLFIQSELNYYNDKSEDKEHYPSALLRLEALF